MRDSPHGGEADGCVVSVLNGAAVPGLLESVAEARRFGHGGMQNEHVRTPLGDPVERYIRVEREVAHEGHGTRGEPTFGRVVGEGGLQESHLHDSPRLRIDAHRHRPHGSAVLGGVGLHQALEVGPVLALLEDRLKRARVSLPLAALLELLDVERAEEPRDALVGGVQARVLRDHRDRPGVRDRHLGVVRVATRLQSHMAGMLLVPFEPEDPLVEVRMLSPVHVFGGSSACVRPGDVQKQLAVRMFHSVRPL